MIEKSAAVSLAIAFFIACSFSAAAQEQKKRTGKLTGELKSQKATPNGKNTIIEVLAPGERGTVMLIAAFLFQPIRDWIQEKLDRHFYRDRYDYRRTVVEFTLDRQGEITDVHVAASSGVQYLDEVAVDAFRIVQRFPNPPPGLIQICSAPNKGGSV